MSQGKGKGKLEAKSKAALLALLLAGDKREPLPLNPVEGRGKAPRLTPAEHRRLIAQGSRKRRNDLLYALLTRASSPLGESR
jgi:hypothetical protein